MKFETLSELLDYLQTLPITAEIQNAYIKAWGNVHGYSGVGGGATLHYAPGYYGEYQRRGGF